MESASVSILVNGNPTDEFKSMRGFRKGDPLVPFLFIIVVEGLVGLVRKAGKAKMLSGMKVGRNAIEFCMLRFADDTLSLCEDSFCNLEGYSEGI